MKKFFFSLIFSLPLLAWAYEPGEGAMAVPSDAIPQELTNVGVTEKLAQKLTLTREFTNVSGEVVPLSTYFGQGRPVIFAMVYYNCPNLCNYQLNGLIKVLKETKGQPGRDYDVVAVSMDHTENPTLAKKKLDNYLKELNMPGAEKAWHFLVGSETNVKALADELGFGFKWNHNLKQFAHAAVTYIVTPGGVISRYLYGIDFSPQTLRMALVEGGEGKIGNIIEKVTLFCFQFDPTRNKYTLYAFNLMRIAAVLTVLALVVFLVPVWMRERQRRATG